MVHLHGEVLKYSMILYSEHIQLSNLTLYDESRQKLIRNSLPVEGRVNLKNFGSSKFVTCGIVIDMDKKSALLLILNSL